MKNYGVKSGWFNESWRHSLAARGVRSSYFKPRKRKVITLTEANRFKAFRGDFLEEKKKIKEELKKARDAVRGVRELKMTRPDLKGDPRLNEMREGFAEDVADAKERLRELNKAIAMADQEGMLDPDERRALLAEDRRATKVRTERAESVALSVKLKDLREGNIDIEDLSADERTELLAFAFEKGFSEQRAVPLVRREEGFVEGQKRKLGLKRAAKKAEEQKELREKSQEAVQKFESFKEDFGVRTPQKDDDEVIFTPEGAMIIPGDKKKKKKWGWKTQLPDVEGPGRITGETKKSIFSSISSKGKSRGKRENGFGDVKEKFGEKGIEVVDIDE